MKRTREERRAAQRANVIKRRFAYVDPVKYFAEQRRVEKLILENWRAAGKRALEASIKSILARAAAGVPAEAPAPHADRTGESTSA